jgi:O-antigen ligase
MFSPDYISHTLERTRLYILVFVTYYIATNHPLFGLGPGAIGSDISGTAAGTNAIFDTNKAATLDIYDERMELLTDVGLVNIFAQIGIFGVISVIFIFFVLYRTGLKLYKTTQDQQLKYIALAYLGITIIMLIQNIFGFALTYRAISLYFWIYSGFIYKEYMQIDDSKKNNTPN